MVVVFVLDTYVPAYELIVPKPVAGNFEVVVPGHFGSAARRASHMPSSAALTSDEANDDSSELSSFIDAEKSSTSTMSRASTKAEEVVCNGTLLLPTAQPNASGNWPSAAVTSLSVRRAATWTTLYGVAPH